MSWFDKLFGEDHESTDNYLTKRHQRRQRMNNDHQLLPQNNDVYERPKGKFRFPMRVLEEHEHQAKSKPSAKHEHYPDQREHRDSGRYEQEASFIERPRQRRRRGRDTRDNVSAQKEDISFDQSSASQRTRYKETQSRTPRQTKIQTEAIRAQKSNQTTPKNYATREFKASEVPSAIFGTHKPKQLHNGVIPSKEDAETAKSDEHSASQYSKEERHSAEEQKQTPSKQLIHSDESPSNVEKRDNRRSSEPQSNDNENSVQQTERQSKGKRHNTIDIEHIYASQIVEEIRRERERKVLQKRQFKKALQQKREEQQAKDVDSVQHAIDEMYAKQAKRYLGESSLDADDASVDTNDVTYDGDDNHTADTPDEEETLNSNHFSYQEVDLDDVSDLHQVDQDRIEVTDADVTQPNENSESTPSQASHPSDQQASNHDNMNDIEGEETLDQGKEVNVSQSATDDENNSHDAVQEQTPDVDIQQSFEQSGTQLSEEADDDQGLQRTHEEAIADAQYRELHDEEDSTEDGKDSELHALSEKSNQDSNNEKGLADSTSLMHTHDQANVDETDTTQTSDESEEKADEQSDATTQFDRTKQAHTQTEPHETTSADNAADGHEDTINQKDEASSKTNENLRSRNNSETDSTANSKSLEETESETKVKRPTRKGAQPFNVLMTPSDKKRSMEARAKQQRSEQTKVPPLKPEMASNQDQKTINKDESRTSERPETSERDDRRQKHLQNPTGSEQTIVNDDHQSNEDLSSVEGTERNASQQTSTATSQPNEAVGDKTPHDNQQSQRVADKKDQNSNIVSTPHSHDPTIKGQSDSENIGRHTTAPNENRQNSVTQNANEASSKPAIRKGPNLHLPKVDLLEEPEAHQVDESWIEGKKQELNDAFYYFNVPAEVQHVTEGPSVTRFELSVEKGVKVSRITALQDDIKMALAAKDIRIEAPIPGTSLVGIEVPNQSPTKVNLRSIIDSSNFKNVESKLTVAMGYRINNEPLLMDIAKTPHALIAGATGSGKSVCINSILMSLLYKNHPEELRLLLIDPKMVELAPYNDLPHLVSPVITDVKAATQSLKWAVDEMERRYKQFAKYHVRNITAFNKKAAYEDRMPKIVIVIDELADLMMMAPQEVEQSIARIAQKARACGIHMLVATQRPSVNVITGLIKANIPTRISFMVSSSVDSRTILDSSGAERLLGYGDMLYLGSGMNKPIRVQGTFVSDDEIDDVVEYIKRQRKPDYIFEEKELLKKNENQPNDPIFNDVCEFMVQEGNISTSLIQRHFQIGYNRAARIVDQLEQLGYISGANGSKPRDVYMTEADLQEN